jgi:hypothetical protein
MDYRVARLNDGIPILNQGVVMLLNAWVGHPVLSPWAITVFEDISVPEMGIASHVKRSHSTFKFNTMLIRA